MAAEYFSTLRPFNCCMNRIGDIPVIGFGEKQGRHGRSIIYAKRLPKEQEKHFDLELIAEGSDVVFWTRLPS